MSHRREFEPDNPREERTAKLLGLLRETSAPEPDGSRRAADLREASADLFLAAHKPAHAPIQPRSSAMLAFVLRGLTTVAAGLLLVLAWFAFAPPATAPFLDVLDRSAQASAWHLRLVRDERTIDVWTVGRSVRWEESPTNYRIAHADKLWQIDESTNSVRAAVADWRVDPASPLDVLGLLELGVQDATPLRRAVPVAGERDGRPSWSYHATVPSARGELEVEAIADRATLRLIGVTARKARRKEPVAELQFVAMNPPVAPEKFVVATTLSDDGRIAKLVDVQGLVGQRPLGGERWRPASRGRHVHPGDWLRTDRRGANAVSIMLTSATELTLGPGSLLECLSPTQARLHSGEVRVRQPEKGAKAFELLSPRQEVARRFERPGTQLVRVARDGNDGLVVVDAEPAWMKGFDGATANESLGSLIVKLPDGRHAPLTVGVHQVRVDIRDQIARTTIEETFVNHTDGRLEGVFHFPLPQEASISGFGMWIGNELVEADVVEKQRAREIYEVILSERRDPGLLEWTGGNIFSARVFPIEPRSEKRIKIVYTQVLPLRDGQFRYSYGLRSELLQTRPLRELSLTATVQSATPLAAIRCPSHPARVQSTTHAGRVEFVDQEVTPTKDFEVVCDLAAERPDVVLVPHRRGNDGYFLLQVNGQVAARREPPGPREPDGVAPDGSRRAATALHLRLLCDTSGSMDREKRKQQAAFVRAVLSSLGPQDRFNVATLDVRTEWLFPAPVAPDEATIDQVQDRLAARRSLGWTDLDDGFRVGLDGSTPEMHVVYVGDGVVSTGDADPQAFLRRLERLTANVSRTLPTLHAVGVGSAFDSVVLRGIVRQTGGSTRMIDGEQTPTVVAREFLAEIAEPGLRDMKVEFRGVRVAAVYPDRLPNLAAGTQQILVGRYLPEGREQTGEVIVTAKRGDATVRFAAKVTLPHQPDAPARESAAKEDDDASFIPRLWARSHLDELLRQGSSAAIRDEIIALSEEFHIITPYTSLLVLESDADRERFGVKRRFEMRDGERFFAQGRNLAAEDLRRQQMLRAARWRVELRRQVLSQLARLGRNPQMGRRQVEEERHRRLMPLWFSGATEFESVDCAPFGNGFADGGFRYDDEMKKEALGLGEDFQHEESSPAPFASPGDDFGEADFRKLSGGSDRDFAPLIDLISDTTRPESWQGVGGPGSIEDFPANLSLEILGGQQVSDVKAELAQLAVEHQPDSSGELDLAKSVWDFESDSDGVINGVFGGGGYGYYNRSSGRGGRWAYRQDYTQWFDQLFPPLPGATGVSRRGVSRPPRTWPADAVELAESLLRTDALTKLDGGLELRRVTESFDPAWKRTIGRNERLELFAPHAWLVRPLSPGDRSLVEWCDAQSRGIFSVAFQLGRARVPDASDRAQIPLDLNDGSLRSLADQHADYRARVEREGEGLARLMLTRRNTPGHVLRYTIDTQRRVLHRIEHVYDGKVTSATVFDDFVQVAGQWWSGTSRQLDAEQRVVSETKQTVTALAKKAFDARFAAERPDSSASPLVLALPLPKVAAARQRVLDKKAGIEDRLVLALTHCRTQEWPLVHEHLDALDKLAPGKPGRRWLRPAVWQVSHQNEALRKFCLAEARLLAQPNAEPRDRVVADQLRTWAYGASGWGEYLELLDVLEPVYRRQPDHLGALAEWQHQRAYALQTLGRVEEELALLRQLATDQPWDVSRQTNYAQRRAQHGDFDAAFAWLQQELDRRPPGAESRSTDELDTLSSAYGDLLHQRGDFGRLVTWTEAWMKRTPDRLTPYFQHLGALVFHDELPRAERLAEQWLQESRVEGRLTPPALARFHAAEPFTRGAWPRGHVQYIDPKWHKPLVDTARFFLRHPHHFALGRDLFNNLRDSAERDALRGELLTTLQADAAKLDLDRLEFLIGASQIGRMQWKLGERQEIDATEVPESVWHAIADAVRKRWKKQRSLAAAARREREQQDFVQRKPSIPSDEELDRAEEAGRLAELLTRVYAARFADHEWLQFLLERLITADVAERPAARRRIFDALLTRPWTDEIERELFQLLLMLSESTTTGRGGQARDSSNDVVRLLSFVPDLQRLVDSLINARQAAARKSLLDSGTEHTLTRQQLAEKRATAERDARSSVAARLAVLADHRQTPAPFVPWLRVEQHTLETRLGIEREAMLKFAWSALGPAPPKPVKRNEDEAAKEPDPNAAIAAHFDALLRDRALALVLHDAVTAKRGAGPSSIDRVLAYFEAGVAVDPPRWRPVLMRLLIALDRPVDLERHLRNWFAADGPTSSWRVPLGWLQAERGGLPEAVALFEAAQKEGRLGSRESAALADWYLVLDRRDDHRRMRRAAFEREPEHVLANRLHQTRSRIQTVLSNTEGVGSTEVVVDDDTRLALEVLLRKSGNPEQYFWIVRELYVATRDFRLLALLPDTLLGRSPQQVYAFLKSCRSVLDEIRHEATVDEMVARIRTLSAGESLTPVDRRALDLLLAQVECRAADVLNQPGPHVTAALAALQRAFDRAWAEGEPRQMAELLANFGKLPHALLVEEQLRQLAGLSSRVADGSRERLHIDGHWTYVLYWQQRRHDEALRRFEATARAYLAAQQGRWHPEDIGPFDAWVAMLEDQRRYAQAEQWLVERLAAPFNDQQVLRLKERRFALFRHALSHDGEVSLGRGSALMKSVVQRHLDEVRGTTDQNHRFQLLYNLASVFAIGRQQKLADTDAEFRRFAFDVLPELLRGQSINYGSLVSHTASTLEEVLGPREALRWLVDRVESYPVRLKYAWENPWNQHGHTLGHLHARARNEKADVSAIEPRLLKFVLEELRRDLSSGDRRHVTFYRLHHNYFWTEKADDFARAAEELLAERPNSGRVAVAIAAYFHDGLGRTARAIEILFAAQAQGRLDFGETMRLVQYLQESNRHGEAIALLEPAVRTQPDVIDHRTRLLRAYFRTQRPTQVRDLLKATHDHFHQAGRWNEGVAASLAYVCRDAELGSEAVGYFTEAIAHRQRTLPNRGVGDESLADYYRTLAQTHAALGQTREAVDAAASAVITVGRHQQRRQESLSVLQQVLSMSPDLGAYVRFLDERAKESGEDSALLRKQIGRVLHSQQKTAAAVTQLRLALDLQPHDQETHEMLVECYDALGDKRAAVTQLLDRLDFERHNLALYKDLAQRLRDDARESDRAATSLIESDPNEAAHHAALAELRQEQNRWPDAVGHWERFVALRRYDPTGLVRLATAQIRAGRKDAARELIGKLRSTEWPPRYGNVSNEVRRLENELK